MEDNAGQCRACCSFTLITERREGSIGSCWSVWLLQMSQKATPKTHRGAEHSLCPAAPRPAAPAEAAPAVPSPAAAVVSATAKKELVQAKRREEELTVRLAAIEAELTTLRSSHGGAQDQIAELSDRLMVHPLSLLFIHPCSIPGNKSESIASCAAAAVLRCPRTLSGINTLLIIPVGISTHLPASIYQPIWCWMLPRWETSFAAPQS